MEKNMDANVLAIWVKNSQTMQVEKDRRRRHEAHREGTAPLGLGERLLAEADAGICGRGPEVWLGRQPPHRDRGGGE